jgi:hypothetical protein
MSMQLGTLTVVKCVLLMGWTGPWIADLTLDDVNRTDPLPTGQQTLTIAGVTFTGTIDPRGTGHLGDTARARLVAGANGWGNILVPEPFHNDASVGVSSSTVLAKIAGEIGETVVDSSPVNYATDFETYAGRASQVLDGRDWYVDQNGITQVAQWPSSTPTDDVIVLEYDPLQRRATFSAEPGTIVWPGTVFVDSRFETITARDVEMVFDASGMHGVIWHSASAVGRLDGALEALVMGFAAPSPLLQTYRYRIVTQSSDGRLNLQLVSKSAGVPAKLPFVNVMPGLPGMAATWTGAQQGLIVLVQFLEGSPTLPRIVGFDGRTPTTLALSAAQELDLSSPLVKAGIPASAQAVTFGAATIQLQTILTAFWGAMNGDPLLPALLPATYAGVQAAVASLATLVSTFPLEGQTQNFEGS